MQRSESITKWTAAMVEVQKVLRPAKKDASNPYFKSNYAPLPTIMATCREPLTQNGFVVIQTTDFDNGVFYVETTVSHVSGEWVSGRYPIKPVKEDPQAYGSAVSYAKRYSLAALISLVSEGEDDDGNAASGKAPEKPKEEPKAPPPKKEAAKDAPVTAEQVKATFKETTKDFSWLDRMKKAKAKLGQEKYYDILTGRYEHEHANLVTDPKEQDEILNEMREAAKTLTEKAA